MSVRPIVLTYEDYCELPDDGKRYEIHEGSIIVNPAPTPGHQWVSGNLNEVIRSHVRERQLGKVFYAPLDCISGEQHDSSARFSVFVANDRLDRISDRGIIGCSRRLPLRSPPRLRPESIAAARCSSTRSSVYRSIGWWIPVFDWSRSLSLSKVATSF